MISKMAITDEERFDAILDKLKDIYTKKNDDYGNSFRQLFEELGMAYPIGHIAEDAQRLISLHKKNGKPSVKGEGIKESLLDCASNCILTYLEMTRYDDIINDY